RLVDGGHRIVAVPEASERVRGVDDLRRAHGTTEPNHPTAMTQDLPPRDQTAAERHASLSRRRFLRGVGACLALPAFESLRVPGARAAAAGAPRALAASPTGAPLRTAFVYFPNGAIPSSWWPTEA